MLDKIRELMAGANIDWLIVFSKDPHLSEYTAKCDKYREALSGFTGSAGTLVISAQEAYMWTDMRYHIQAGIQLSGTGITLMKYGMPNVLSMEDFLCEHVWDGMTVGFDFMTASYERYINLSDRLPSTIDIVDAHDILTKSVDMDKRAHSDVRSVPEDLAGKSFEKKLSDLRSTIKKRYANDESYTYILSDLTSQMWLFNLRGEDIDYVPVAYCYTLVTVYDATLFIDKRHLLPDAKEKLEKAGVTIREYRDFYNALSDIATDIVIADPDNCNARILAGFDNYGIFRKCNDNVLITKAVKNHAEIDGMRKAHLKDAVTMIRFIKKIKETAASGELTDEYDIGSMLDDMRLKGGCESLSFETICAYGDDAAIVHYSANEQSSKKVSSSGFLLVDSGGQYRYEGTTDITRTISLGELTEEEKRAYTTVLKGNLRLMDMVFPEGFEGTMLDSIAEEPLWEAGYYCGHGIGHGVGCNLSVHESEARISRRTQNNEIVFRPGVIVSNEPGVYIEGKFGVRLENLLLVTAAGECDSHKMCRFEPLTLVLFDREAIDKYMLSDRELDILARYNKLIYEKVSPYLENDEKFWLKENIDIK